MGRKYIIYNRLKIIKLNYFKILQTFHERADLTIVKIL